MVVLLRGSLAGTTLGRVPSSQFRVQEGPVVEPKKATAPRRTARMPAMFRDLLHHATRPLLRDSWRDSSLGGRCTVLFRSDTGIGNGHRRRRDHRLLTT